MARGHFSRERPVGFFFLMEPRADGPVVGSLDGHPIASAVIDYFGRRFTYVGAAPRLRNGLYDVEALSPGEWFVEPGLIYRKEPDRGSGLLAKFRRSRERPARDSAALQ
jgi:hypothetical protein